MKILVFFIIILLYGCASPNPPRIYSAPEGVEISNITFTGILGTIFVFEKEGDLFDQQIPVNYSSNNGKTSIAVTRNKFVTIRIIFTDTKTAEHNKYCDFVFSFIAKQTEYQVVTKIADNQCKIFLNGEAPLDADEKLKFWK